MSPLSSTERSQKYRLNVNNSPAKRKLSKNRRRLRHYQSKAKKLIQKLSDSFETQFKMAKMEGKLKVGWYFTVDKCFDFSFQQCIELKKCLNSGHKWAGLGDDGRYYTKNDDNSWIDKVTNKKFSLTKILRSVFQDQKNISPMKFIKHSAELNELQGFHVDDKDQYKKVRDMNSDDLHQYTFHDFGYSVFVGLDKVNTLIVGRANEEQQEIESVTEVKFPFRSILVISTHLPHRGNKFSSLNDVHHTRSDNTKYNLKGFVAIGDDPIDGQGWFVQGRDNYCGPR